MIKRTLTTEVHLTREEIDDALRRAASLKYMEAGDMMGAFDALHGSDVIIDLADGELGADVVGAYVTFDQEVEDVEDVEDVGEEPEEEVLFISVKH